MALNRYYIVDPLDPNIIEIMGITVGAYVTQRENFDKSLMVIKLYKGDAKQHECLKDYTKYNHNQIRIQMDDGTWPLH